MISAPEEVDRLHRFIEAWMAGDPVAADDWELFGAALGPNFSIVNPRGATLAKADLLASFAGARGVMPGVRIEIRQTAVLHEAGDTAIVRYEEWQLHPTQANQRVATVVLERCADAPGGWWWLALHETTMLE
jgi:hypothetical protein